MDIKGTLGKGAFNNHVDKKGWVVSQMSTFVQSKWVGTPTNIHMDIACFR